MDPKGRGLGGEEGAQGEKRRRDRHPASAGWRWSSRAPGKSGHSAQAAETWAGAAGQLTSTAAGGPLHGPAGNGFQAGSGTFQVVRGDAGTSARALTAQYVRDIAVPDRRVRGCSSPRLWQPVGVHQDNKWKGPRTRTPVRKGRGPAVGPVELGEQLLHQAREGRPASLRSRPKLAKAGRHRQATPATASRWSSWGCSPCAQPGDAAGDGERSNATIAARRAALLQAGSRMASIVDTPRQKAVPVPTRTATRTSTRRLDRTS